MTDTKHTPWKITQFADGTVGIHAPDGNHHIEVAVLRGRFAMDHAKLIAAAPDLLEALKVARTALNSVHETDGLLDHEQPALAVIDAALSKAGA